MLSQCLIHVYLHASQDKEDDLKVGVKSTALRFGDLTKYWISGFGAACIGSLVLSGYNADLGWCLVRYLSEVVFFLLDIDSRPEIISNRMALLSISSSCSCTVSVAGFNCGSV